MRSNKNPSVLGPTHGSALKVKSKTNLMQRWNGHGERVGGRAVRIVAHVNDVVLCTGQDAAKSRCSGVIGYEDIAIRAKDDQNGDAVGEGQFGIQGLAAKCLDYPAIRSTYG